MSGRLPNRTASISLGLATWGLVNTQDVSHTLYGHVDTARRPSRDYCRPGGTVQLKPPVVFVGILIGTALSRCATTASQSTYQPPPVAKVVNEKTIDAPFEDVWKQTLSRIAQSFFTINNIEKDSGFLNLSYTGNSGIYVDCGTTVVAGQGGAQSLNFSESTSAVETVDTRGNTILTQTQAKLDTKMNLVFLRETDETTRVSINIQYHVKIADLSVVKAVSGTQTLAEILMVAGAVAGAGMPMVPMGPQPGQVVHQGYSEATFRSGQVVPVSNSNVLCGATGQMEQDILDLVFVQKPIAGQKPTTVKESVAGRTPKVLSIEKMAK